MRIVVDTNVFLGACLGDGASDRVVAGCLTGQFSALMGSALFTEYEDVLSRANLFRKCRLDAAERDKLLDIFAANCEWVTLYCGWHPDNKDSKDEQRNYLIELAVAGGANAIASYNQRDFKGIELVFPDIAIMPPEPLLKG